MSSTTTAPLPVFRLLVLSGAIFVSVSSEFLPTGLLPDMARDLGVSESRIGFLVSAFAATVVLTSIPLTLLTRQLPRKAIMLVMLGAFAVSNVIAGLAPNYEILLASRILGGLAHGLFWSVTGPYTALLVQPRQLARAISITNAGGSMAFIAGVPITAAIGHALGWRSAFLVMAGIVIVFTVLVAVALPPREHRVSTRTGEIVVPLHRDRSLVALGIVAATVLLVATGHNTLYTYIAPWSIEVGGVRPELVSLELLVFGVAGLVGLLLVGVFGGRWPRLTMNLGIALLALTIVLMALFGTELLPTILLASVWSLAFGGLPALFHTRSLHGSSARVRTISGSVVTTAFNLAIGLGALFGGLALDGWGTESVPWLAAVIVVAGLIWAVASDRARIAAHPAEAHLG